MRWVVMLSLLGGCAPAELQGDPAAQHRQPFTGTPTLWGPDGGRLGASLAPCRGSGFVAGAPGAGTAFSHLSASFPTAPLNDFGRAVACEGAPGLLLVFSGGQAGLRKFSGPSLSATTFLPVFALARSNSTSLPLLVGEAGGVVRFRSSSTLGETALPLTGASPSFGATLAWFPVGARFAVGSPDAGRVDLYDYVADAGGAHAYSVIETRPGFGRALAVGDVSPRFGLELVVGGAGAVFIYGEDGTPISTLSGGPSFGSSLAIETDWAPGLDALWVGEPDLDRIHVFVGDSGVADSYTPTGIRFGASLSMDPSGELAVGAPGFPDGQRGAVFTQVVRPGVTRVGDVADCDVSLGCVAPGCMRGTCRGGVFCEGLFNACSPGEICDPSLGFDRCLLPDGGVPDAGPRDAGPPDAGPPDAGQPDAGQPDAGQPDAGQPDAGQSDAGQPDAGQPDAGQPDAGQPDAGKPDAGPDAGSLDSGQPLPDGGMAPPGPLVFSACGCSGGALPLALLCLALLRPRRPGARSRSSPSARSR